MRNDHGLTILDNGKPPAEQRPGDARCPGRTFHPRGLQLIKRALVLLLFITAVLVAFALFSAARTREQAQTFLGQLLRLEVGHSTFVDVNELADRFHGESFGVGSLPPLCSPEYGRFSFSIVSNWQGILRVGPRRAVIANVEIARDRLRLRYVALAFHGDKYLEVFADERIAWQSGEDVRVVQRENNLPSIGFELSPTAPASVRSLAFNFNLTCLDWLKGCKSPDEVLPALKTYGKAIEESILLIRRWSSGHQP